MTERLERHSLKASKGQVEFFPPAFFFVKVPQDAL